MSLEPNRLPLLFKIKVKDRVGHEQEFSFTKNVTPGVMEQLITSGVHFGDVMEVYDSFAVEEVLKSSIEWRCAAGCNEKFSDFFRRWSFCGDFDPPQMEARFYYPICNEPRCRSIVACLGDKEVEKFAGEGMHQVSCVLNCSACHAREEPNKRFPVVPAAVFVNTAAKSANVRTGKIIVNFANRRSLSTQKEKNDLAPSSRAARNESLSGMQYKS